MTADERITALEDQFQKLQDDTLAQMQQKLMRLRNMFTPSGWLDPRRLPQLTGDVVHLAGTEPVTVVIGDGTSVQNIRIYDSDGLLVDTVDAVQFIRSVVGTDGSTVTVTPMGDRWSYPAPAISGGGLVQVNVTGTGTSTVLSKTETGKLIDIGIVNVQTTSGTAWTLKLRITIDGGAAQDIPIIDAGPVLNQTFGPWCANSPPTLTTLGDTAVQQFFMEYETSILVEAIVGGSAGGAGGFYFTARRSVLT